MGSAQKLTLATIHLMDNGAMQELFNKMVGLALADCDDRPSDETPREVKLVFMIKPISVNGRTCNKVSIDAKVMHKLPDHRTVPVDVALRKTAEGFIGLFNPDAPEDADQTTLGLGGAAGADKKTK